MWYRKTIDLDPEFAQTHNDLGVMFIAQGKPNEFLACFQRALTIDPELEQAISNLERIENE